MMLLNHFQELFHRLAFKIVLVITDLILIFVFEKLLPRDTEHGNAEDDHDDGDDCDLNASEEKVVH